MKVYVLRKFGSLKFICVNSNIDDLKIEIERCFYNWKGLRSRGGKENIEDYMNDKRISEIFISDISNKEVIK